MSMHGVIYAALALTALAPSAARACTPPPANVRAERPSQRAIDGAADRLFAGASYIAQVTVVRAPRHRHLNETGDPLPGLLRVEAVIKGSPPAMLSVPLADPCGLYFQRIGERVIVLGLGRNNIPSQLAGVTIASLKRRRMGNWSAVH